MDHISSVYVGGAFRVTVQRQGEIVARREFRNRVSAEGIRAFWATAIGSSVSGGSTWYTAMLRWSNALFIGNEGRLFLASNDWADFKEGGAYDVAVISSVAGYGGNLEELPFSTASGGGIQGSVTLPAVSTLPSSQALEMCGFLITNAAQTTTTDAVLWCTAGTSTVTITNGDIVTVDYTLVTSSSTIYTP